MGKRSYTLILTTLGLCAILMLGCFFLYLSFHEQRGDQADCKQVLKLVLPIEPTHLDPRFVDDSSTGGIVRLINDGLSRLGPDGQLRLSLAENYTISKDQKTYTFIIRDKAKWSDGKNLTAFDVERSWKSILNTSFKSQFSYLFDIIENIPQIKKGYLKPDEAGIRALDEKTLQIRLNHPCPIFLRYLAIFPFMPTRFYDPSKASGDFYRPVCGPFIVKTFSPAKGLTLVKNPHYWDSDAVHIDEIEIYFEANPQKALEMFDAGQIHFLGRPFGDLYQNEIYKTQNSLAINYKPAASSFWIEVNTLRTPLNNIHLRRALSLSLNRQAIATLMDSQRFSPALTFLPATLQLNPRAFALQSCVGEAKRELQLALNELNITAEEIELSILFCERSYYLPLTEAIADSWRKYLGIKVKVEPVERDQFMKRVTNGDFDLARSVWGADFHDPINYLDVLKYADSRRSGNNHTGWQNLNYTDLLDRASYVEGTQDRHVLLAEAERILLDELPIISLLDVNINWLQAPNLRYVIVSDPGIVDFKWAQFYPNMCSNILD